MSGGAFDYKQWHIEQIADEVEKLIEKNGREKTREELKEEGWRNDDWYEKYPEDKFHYKYRDEMIEAFKEAVNVLRVAQIYAHRIDWYMSGDDGEESFMERLKEDLNELKNK
jgi:predicted SAM-dependent methyltransferase